jgi:RNase adapter protein RapZ
MTPERIDEPADAVNTKDKPRPSRKGESTDMGVSKPVRLGDRLRRGRRGRAAVRPAGSNLDDLVIITGFSGAGKSTAMAVFEDAGYFCVDNLPPEMIRSLTELFMHEGSNVECAAIVSDVRGGAYFDDLAAVLEELDRAGVRRRVSL